MARKISWTPLQEEIAAHVRQGESNKELVAAGYNKTTVSRVRQMLKSEGKGGGDGRKQGGNGWKQGGEKIESHAPSPTGEPQGQSKVAPRSLESVVVGSFIIDPADWRINQYGGFLILTTYEHARQKYGYSGTVGDFLCDSVQVMRHIMGLSILTTEYLIHKEDDNGREPESDGRHLLPEVGDDGAGGKPEE